MAILYERLKNLCDEKGITGAKLCDDIGYRSHSLLSELKYGRKKTINAEVATRIADYFNVSVAYILGKTENPSTEISKGGNNIEHFTVYAMDGTPGAQGIDINMDTLPMLDELLKVARDLPKDKIEALIATAKAMK